MDLFSRLFERNSFFFFSFLQRVGNKIFIFSRKKGDETIRETVSQAEGFPSTCDVFRLDSNVSTSSGHGNNFS